MGTWATYQGDRNKADMRLYCDQWGDQNDDSPMIFFGFFVNFAVNHEFQQIKEGFQVL